MRYHDNRNTILYARHYGFLRICLQNGLPIVPILVFGEMLSLSLLSVLPKIQRWVYKNLRVFLPLPHGRWFTFMPKPIPVTIVFGKPFLMKRIENPTIDEIATYHIEYFARIRKLFYLHRKEAGYASMKLYLISASPDGSDLV
uniref:Acyl-CoA wax alcohol acyltransferase 2 n=1 Tax=Lygus hesperus TaxID=30085 RepID=A0A0A9XRG6_LYGHE